MYETIASSYVYYYSVDEFAEKILLDEPQNPTDKISKINHNRIVRVAGVVKYESALKNTNNIQYAFILSGQKHRISVIYSGTLPKNFAEGKEIIVEGKTGNDKTFHANRVLTRCESKYKVKSNTP